MHVGGGADRSTSRADPPQGADGDHRAGEGDPRLRAALCGPNPQHVLIYGPPGVGKTAAARLILEEAKAREESPFRQKAKFVEIDATARNLTSATLPIRCSALSMTRSIRGGGGVLAGGHPPAQTGGGDVPRALFGLYGNARAKYAGADRRDRSAWQILPVGGVEDKLEAAQQAGATLALIPQENWREVYREIEVVPVGDAETLLRRVFPPGEGATLSEGMEFLVGQEIG